MAVVKKAKIVAIDGPAGSGKSTAARMLADAEGLAHLNTGAMYRAVTYLAEKAGFNTTLDTDRVASVARAMVFHYDLSTGSQHFLVCDDKDKPSQDITEELFTVELTEKLKPVVNNEAVREILVDKMRIAAQEVLESGQPGVVLEGRDIGTVVFPDADIKFFVHANLAARSRRRAKELEAKGETVDLEVLQEQLRKRDASDQERTMGPLKKADDAIDLDTSEYSPAEVLTILCKKLHEI